MDGECIAPTIDVSRRFYVVHRANSNLFFLYLYKVATLCSLFTSIHVLSPLSCPFFSHISLVSFNLEKILIQKLILVNIFIDPKYSLILPQTLRH